MSPTIRNLLTSLLIAAVAPMAMAALDLEQAAYAGNGNGGGKGGGNGGGNGGGKGGGHGNKGDTAKAEAKAAKTKTDEESDGEGLKPNELGKLNGVLHASPNAIAHANENSPIGTARAFGEALAGFLGLGDEETTDEGTTEGEGDAVADDETTDIDQLGEMMAKMTNKPVTADQVQAVADKLVSEGHLSKVSSAAGATGGIDSRVVKVDGNRAYINIGSSSGVKVGDKFVIIHRGEEIVDPVSGMKLGAEEKQTGTGVVVEVAERYAIMTVTGKAIAADVIKKQ